MKGMAPPFMKGGASLEAAPPMGKKGKGDDKKAARKGKRKSGRGGGRY